MISPNTEESCLQENNLSKRSIVLENQIEQMLNKLMIDENDEASYINFCDAEEEIEDDQSDRSLEKELYNNQENLNHFQYNGDFSINNSQSTSPSFSFKRKYHTTSQEPFLEVRVSLEPASPISPIGAPRSFEA